MGLSTQYDRDSISSRLNMIETQYLIELPTDDLRRTEGPRILSFSEVIVVFCKVHNNMLISCYLGGFCALEIQSVHSNMRNNLGKNIKASYCNILVRILIWHGQYRTGNEKSTFFALLFVLKNHTQHYPSSIYYT